MKPFSSIPEAIKELKKGHMLIVVDSPKRENQGDIIFPSQTVTADKVNFLLKECRGIICVAITKEHALRLDLPLMLPPLDNTETTNVQFTVSVDAKNVVSFCIAASDRAKTIQALADIQSAPHDFIRPGHIFPLLARDGGVKERAGHTEATVELCSLAGFSPCGVLCEVLRDDGEIARLPELTEFSKQHKIKMISVTDLISYLNKKKSAVINYRETRKEATAFLMTEYGRFELSVYKSITDNREHVVLRMGKQSGVPVLTRIHSQCITGDTFHSLKCDCYAQLHKSLQMIKDKKQGILLYLNQEGRGIGLANKIKAYALQEKGYDTVEANHVLGFPADARTYKVAAEILKDLGIYEIDLLTNNPEKEKQLSKFAIRIRKAIPLEIKPNGINTVYLTTKKKKLGHLLSVV